MVAWGTFSGSNFIGTHDAWIVQHRQQNTDETWPDWPTGVVKAAAKLPARYRCKGRPHRCFHTFTGLANGNLQRIQFHWNARRLDCAAPAEHGRDVALADRRGQGRVQVIPRSANTEDHDNDPNTIDQTVHRLGFASEIQTVTLAAGNTTAPGRVTGGTVTPGVGSLIVEWEPPEGDGSSVYAYQVRHRRGDYDFSDGGGDWTVGPEINPRQTRRMCEYESSALTCENPRRYEITDLIGGRDHDVAVRAKNANGWGNWLGIGRFNLPNGFPPVLQSAAVNGATLTLTFDRSLDTDSKPSTSVFSVSVNGTSQVPTGVAMSGSTVTLTLGTAVTMGQTVTVSYIRPAQTPLQHNDVQGPSFSDEPVTNNTP